MKIPPKLRNHGSYEVQVYEFVVDVADLSRLHQNIFDLAVQVAARHLNWKVRDLLEELQMKKVRSLAEVAPLQILKYWPLQKYPLRCWCLVG